jgi:2-polyprenyl-6-methoxyphenol hydroxylase-like FAD-dependent oxidoreductase
MTSRVVVVGGGIGGLTLAAMSKQRAGLTVILLERFALSPTNTSLGGGIALWPPAQLVMRDLGVLRELESVGAYMPPPAYRSKDGTVLARPSGSFSSKFPVSVTCTPRPSTQMLLVYVRSAWQPHSTLQTAMPTRP